MRRGGVCLRDGVAWDSMPGAGRRGGAAWGARTTIAPAARSRQDGTGAVRRLCVF